MQLDSLLLYSLSGYKYYDLEDPEYDSCAPEEPVNPPPMSEEQLSFRNVWFFYGMDVYNVFRVSVIKGCNVFKQTFDTNVAVTVL